MNRQVATISARARRCRAVWAAILLATTSACAGGFNPLPIEQVEVSERSQTQSEAGITVTTAVPSRSETKQLFGANLYGRGVQPVWLSIENGRDQPIAFLPVGLDPQYFTPVEASNLDVRDDDEAGATRAIYFLDQQLDLWVEPGATRAGYVFTKVDEGTKAFNVDIIGEEDAVTFTFFVPVPGLAVDHRQVDWEKLYAPDEIVDLDAETLVTEIGMQPCCTTDKKAEGSGDPLNLVVIGDPDDIYTAFIRAGWDETETITRASLIKTVASFFSGGEYRYSPVSGLFVFGRPQDVAFQKARDNIHERNHLRLWMSPARFEGKPVWMGQISRDIGVRFTTKTITTHKIDPDVDETREFLLEDLAYSQALAGFGYAGGVGEAPIDAPRSNLTGDPYFTDGYRLVLWVSASPIDLADVEYVEWATPPSQRD